MGGIENNHATTCAIVISPIGDPSRYSPVYYKVTGCIDTQAKEVLSAYSTIPLLECLLTRKRYHLLRLYVIGLDSIIDSKSLRQKSPRVEKDVSGEGSESHTDESLVFTSYKDIISKSIEIFSGYLSNFYESYTRDRDLKEKLINLQKIVVLPALGSPGGRWRFIGCPDDITSQGLYCIVRDAVNNTDFSQCKKIEVIIDTTYGINYLTTLLMRLVDVMGELIWIKTGLDTDIVAYNSDPYPASGATNQSRSIVLNINEIHRRKVNHVIITVPMELKPIWILSESDGTERCRVNKKLFEQTEESCSREIKSNIKNILHSTYLPTPLALLCACHGLRAGGSGSIDGEYSVQKTIEKIQNNCLDEVYKMWLDSISVDINKFEVNRKVCMDSESTLATIIALTVCSIVNNVIKDKAFIDVKDNQDPNTIITVLFDLELLEEVAEKIYRRIHGSFYYFISREISQIKLKSRQKKPGLYIYSGPRRGVSDERESEGGSVDVKPIDKQVREPGLYPIHNTEELRSLHDKVKSIQERDLVAHAGLPYDAVVVKIVRENRSSVEKEHEKPGYGDENAGNPLKIYIGYGNGRILRMIFDKLGNIARKGVY